MLLKPFHPRGSNVPTLHSYFSFWYYSATDRKMLLAKPVQVVEEVKCSCFLCAGFDFSDPVPAPSKFHRTGVKILHRAEPMVERAAKAMAEAEAERKKSEGGGKQGEEGPLVGKKVRIMGLTQLTRDGEDVNGRVGMCTKYYRRTGRYAVHVLSKKKRRGPGWTRGRAKSKGSGTEGAEGDAASSKLAFKIASLNLKPL